MMTAEIIQTWKDEEYREGLGGDELLMLPGNPAGIVELSDEDLADAAGGATPTVTTSSGYCAWGGGIVLGMGVAYFTRRRR